MADQHIVEGLRNALARGSTLEQAMMSFFNAGYKKEEIEEAARILHEHPSHPMSHPAKPIPEEMKKPVEKAKPLTPEKPNKPKVSQYIPKKLQDVKPKVEAKPGEKKPEEKTPEEKIEEKQKISKYEEKTKPKGKFMVILLIILLFLLVAGLIGVFLFKDAFLGYLSKIF